MLPGAATDGDCSNGSCHTALIKTEHMSLPCTAQADAALSADKRTQRTSGPGTSTRTGSSTGRDVLAPSIAGHLSRRATIEQKKIITSIGDNVLDNDEDEDGFVLSCGSGRTSQVESDPPTDRFTLG